MPYMTRIPSDLARFGLKVELVPGWATRGSSSFAPACVVDHWTAGPRGTAARPSLKVVIDGRPGIAGPLCNIYLDRRGVCVVVAAGRANHAGAGGFRGLVGNSAAYGIEAESGGDGDWTLEQLDAYPRLNAALLSGLGRDASWVCGHNEWAPTRKIDIRDIIAAVRARTATILTAQEDDMFTDLDRQIMGEIRAQLTGSARPNEYPGLPADLVTNGKPRTVVQALGDLARGMQTIYDTLTPGKTGVKFNGDLWAKVSDTHALVIAVEALLRQSDLNGADIDLTTLAADITAGVTANITSQLLAQVGDVVREALGADNKDQADEIVTALGLRIAA